MMHIKNSVILSLKNELFKEMFKMSSAAAQQASMKAHRTRSVAAPNPTRGSTQPTDNSAPRVSVSWQLFWPGKVFYLPMNRSRSIQTSLSSFRLWWITRLRHPCPGSGKVLPGKHRGGAAVDVFSREPRSLCGCVSVWEVSDWFLFADATRSATGEDCVIDLRSGPGKRRPTSTTSEK